MVAAFCLLLLLLRLRAGQTICAAQVAQIWPLCTAQGSANGFFLAMSKQPSSYFWLSLKGGGFGFGWTRLSAAD